jgi:hypothetical protein
MYYNSEPDDQPNCFWIGADGDQPSTGFQVRWPAFAKEEHDENNIDPQRMCNGINFGVRDEKDPDTISSAFGCAEWHRECFLPALAF